MPKENFWKATAARKGEKLKLLLVFIVSVLCWCIWNLCGFVLKFCSTHKTHQVIPHQIGEQKLELKVHLLKF